MNYRPPALNIMQYPGAEVIRLAENSWRLEISACTDREYRLAQLDDHKNLKRSEFRWKPPASLKLKARVSAEHLPGTWGFGFWNYPFTILLSGDLKMQGLPTLPEAIWYFHASSHNYLSFRNDLPATGFLASTFSSKKVPTASFYWHLQPSH